MKIIIANHDCTIIWDGVYYFALSDYPNISSWELKKILSFIKYEKQHGRATEIDCGNEQIITAVNNVIENSESIDTETVAIPPKITECTYCKQGGCITNFVCHTATSNVAKKIFRSGKLLSAVKAFGKNGQELVCDSRNAAGDPPDYFEYIMFNWGNCTGGYRLSMERDLKRNPTEHELENKFIPGIRFYFEYNEIIKHNGYIFDGYHPVKIKEELILSDYLYACIVPNEYKNEFVQLIPRNLANKVYYIPHNGLGLRDWSNKVYNFTCAL